MAKEYVAGYRAIWEFSFSHVEKFVDICPDDIWARKFGGWPVGEQYFHALTATGMLIASITHKPVANPAPQFGALEKGSDACPDKDVAKAFLMNVMEAGRAMFDALTDADLLKKNEGVSEKFGRSVSNAEVIGLMGGHALYHLGSCDAAMREEGVAGSW